MIIENVTTQGVLKYEGRVTKEGMIDLQVPFRPGTAVTVLVFETAINGNAEINRDESPKARLSDYKGALAKYAHDFDWSYEAIEEIIQSAHKAREEKLTRILSGEDV